MLPLLLREVECLYSTPNLFNDVPFVPLVTRSSTSYLQSKITVIKKRAPLPHRLLGDISIVYIFIRVTKDI